MKSDIAYVLTSNKRLNFTFPEYTKSIRISLRPIIDSEELKQNKKPHVRYAFKYILTSSKGTILAKRSYKMRQSTADSKIKIARQRHHHPAPNLQPLSARILNIANKNVAGAHLSLRLESKQAIIKYVLVRVRYLDKVPDYRAMIEWRQLAEKWKKLYGENSIFKLARLTEAEKRYIVSQKWHPIAPSGIAGKDFEEVYLTRNYRPIDIKVPIKFALSNMGIDISPHRKMVFTITTPENHILFRFFSHETHDKPKQTNENIHVTIKYFGRTFAKKKEFKIHIKKLPFSKRLPFPSGIIECSSDKKVFVTASLVKEGKFKRLIHPSYTRTFQATPNSRIEFKIEHPKQQPSVFRFDLRKIAETIKAIKQPGQLVYHLLDKNHHEIFRHTLSSEPTISEFDFSYMNPKLYVSQARKYFFELPNTVHYLTITGQRQLYVNAFSRPYQHFRVRRIPEDYFSSASSSEKATGWFTFYPSNAAKLELKKQRNVLWIQRKPPIYPEHIIKDYYFVHRLHPQGDVSGYYIIRPAQTDNHRGKGSSSTYVELKTNKSLSLNFSSRLDTYYLRPTLIVTNLKKESSKLSILLDDKRKEATIYQSPAYISLFDIPSGKHTIKISTDDKVRVFLNYVEPLAWYYIKQMVFPINKSGFKIILLKDEAGTSKVSGNIYLPAKINAPTKLFIKVSYQKKPRYLPWTTWTFLRREYIISPDLNGQSIALQGGMQLDLGHPFAFSLGEDIPAGKYPIELSTNFPAPRFISLAVFKPMGDSHYQFRRRSITHQ